MSASYLTWLRRAALNRGRRTSRSAFVAMMIGMTYTQGPRLARSARATGRPGIWIVPEKRKNTNKTTRVMPTHRRARAFRQLTLRTNVAHAPGVYLRPVPTLSALKGLEARSPGTGAQTYSWLISSGAARRARGGTCD